MQRLCGSFKRATQKTTLDLNKRWQSPTLNKRQFKALVPATPDFRTQKQWLCGNLSHQLTDLGDIFTQAFKPELERVPECPPCSEHFSCWDPLTGFSPLPTLCGSDSLLTRVLVLTLVVMSSSNPRVWVVDNNRSLRSSGSPRDTLTLVSWLQFHCGSLHACFCRDELHLSEELWYAPSILRCLTVGCFYFLHNSAKGRNLLCAEQLNPDGKMGCPATRAHGDTHGLYGAARLVATHIVWTACCDWRPLHVGDLHFPRRKQEVISLGSEEVALWLRALAALRED